MSSFLSNYYFEPKTHCVFTSGQWEKRIDYASITDSGLGLNKQWVRITEITENDDGSLSMTAEEYLAGTGSSPLYSYQLGQGFVPSYNASPGNANQPVIFEPTAGLAESLEVWIAASGGLLWGGCDVYISSDANSYKNVGRINGSARTGFLTAALPSITANATGQTIDTVNTLAVNLSQSNGQLLSGAQIDATSLVTLCYVDGEYIAYQNATLTSSNQYNLSWLVRGAYGTPTSSHNAGSSFARLDGAILKYRFTQDYIGSTIYIKLVSFNIYGGGAQSLAGVQPYSYKLQGTAFSSSLPAPTNLRTSYIASLTQLAWDEIQDFRPVLYEVRKGTAWTGAQVLGRIAHPPFNIQGDGTYWVAAYSQPVVGLQVYSSVTQNISVQGAQITSNVIASYDEMATGWGGILGGTATLVSGQIITSGAGNILIDADYLNTLDILYYGLEGNGTYEIPVAHQIDISRVAPCGIIISWGSLGQHIYYNILNVSDLLGFSDVLDYSSSANVNVYPEISLSQNGTTWSAWQKYSAGSYIARKFKARMQLQTFDPTVEAILTGFVFAVDVPDRDDHYVNKPIAAGGTTITFVPDGTITAAPFNGGPQGSPSVPNIQVTILNAQAGDIAVISGVSLSACTIQILNGGVGVARNVNLLVQGY